MPLQITIPPPFQVALQPMGRGPDGTTSSMLIFMDAVTGMTVAIPLNATDQANLRLLLDGKQPIQTAVVLPPGANGQPQAGG